MARKPKVHRARAMAARRRAKQQRSRKPAAKQPRKQEKASSRATLSDLRDRPNQGNLNPTSKLRGGCDFNAWSPPPRPIIDRDRVRAERASHSEYLLMLQLAERE
jgi:hypothetical protein